MVSSTQTETVTTDDDDNWGEEDSMDKVSAPTKREFIITGAKGSSIDKELYTEENVTEAIAKIKNAKRQRRVLVLTLMTIGEVLMVLTDQTRTRLGINHLATRE